MTRPTWDDAAALARRTLYDVAYAAAVGASHLERARNLAAVAADRILPPRPELDRCALPGCRGPMYLDRHPTKRVNWWHCGKCGHSAVGVPVREAA